MSSTLSLPLPLRIIDRYIGFTLNALKELWAYRFRLLIWVLYDFTMIFVQYYLWTAVFANSGGSLSGISVGQYISYIATVMIVGRIISCRIDGEIAEQIKDGNISMNLTKPFSYFGMMVAKRVGYTLGDTVALLPVILVSAFMLGNLSADPLIILETCLSVALGYALNTVITYFLGITAFWIVNYWGLFLFKGSIIALFSGEVIALDLLFRLGRGGAAHLPLPFVNAEALSGILLWFGRLAYCLPFQATQYTPSAILTGLIADQRSVLFHIGLQVFWLIVMSLLAALAWSRGLRRVTIMGG